MSDSALDNERRAMSLDDVLHYRESKSGAPSLTGSALVDPIKSFRDSRYFVRRDADAVIRDGEGDLPITAMPDRELD